MPDDTEEEGNKKNEDELERVFEKLEETNKVIGSKEFQAIFELLMGPEGELAKEGASAAVELIKWIMEPTSYEDWAKKKDPERLDEPIVPKGEIPANAPNVTAEIVGAECKGQGWLEVRIKVTGTAGADNDDIKQMELRLPSIDCHGYRASPPPKKFDGLFENETEEHTFTLRIKCSDLISRSTTKIDVFLWVELIIVDDDRNQRTVFMKLSSPELDQAAAKCCRQPKGQVKPKPETPASLEASD